MVLFPAPEKHAESLWRQNTLLQSHSALLSAVQAQVDKQKIKEVLGTIAGKVDEPKLVGGGLRWWVACFTLLQHVPSHGQACTIQTPETSSQKT